MLREQKTNSVRDQIFTMYADIMLNSYVSGSFPVTALNNPNSPFTSHVWEWDVSRSEALP